MNRRRRRRAHPGTWPPAVAEASDEEWLDTCASPQPDPEARYGLLESATFAYLLALEALPPRPRAALLLRDVLGYSAAETAAALEYTALAMPMVGRTRVARFYTRAAAERIAGNPTLEIRLVNGLPAAVVTLARPVRRQAPRSVLFLDLADDGRVQTIHTLLAPRKLAAVRFAPAQPSRVESEPM